MSRENDELNSTQLIQAAVKENFIESLSDYETRRKVIERYNFSSAFRDAFLLESITNYVELLDAISKIMRRLYSNDLKDDYLGSFRYRLHEQNFSKRFVNTFNRLTNNRIGWESDILKIHFSTDVPLRDLVTLEGTLDKTYRQIMLSSNTLEGYTGYQPIVRVRAFSHPASTELFFGALTIVVAAAGIAAIADMVNVSIVSTLEGRNRRRTRSIIASIRASATENTEIPVTDEVLALANPDEIAGSQLPEEAGSFRRSVSTQASNPGDYVVVRSKNFISGFEVSE